MKAVWVQSEKNCLRPLLSKIIADQEGRPDLERSGGWKWGIFGDTVGGYGCMLLSKKRGS
jgi:hypothetical protein